jgi:hypothetical protein
VRVVMAGSLNIHLVQENIDVSARHKDTVGAGGGDARPSSRRQSCASAWLMSARLPLKHVQAGACLHAVSINMKTCESSRSTASSVEILRQSPLSPLTGGVLVSADGTLKLLIRLADGLAIETVLIPPLEPDRAQARSSRAKTSLCVSSQVGCMRGCCFCRPAPWNFDECNPRTEITV